MQVNSDFDLKLISGYFKEGLIHRGPDAQREWFASDTQLVLSHTRLSILDLSEQADQPMKSINGDVIITFNGEIYNYAEVRDELEKLNNYQWITDHSDTEVIIHAYEQWGINCIDKFRGIFAFGLWDNIKKELYIVRDRFGVKPVYYVSQPGHFGFSSELKPFFKIFKEKKINQNGVIEYLTSRSSVAPNTMVADMYKLEKGHYLRVKLNEYGKSIDLSLIKYYDLERQISLNSYDFSNKKIVLRELEEHIHTSIKYHWISDTPVCLFLSGGIDSSLIAAISSHLFDTKIQAFTIGLPNHQNDETRFAKQVAKKFSIDLEVLDFSNNPFDTLNEWLYYNDDLLSDPAAFALFYLSKRIKNKGFKVVLSGEGSDEIFAGYGIYLEFLNRSLLNRENLLFKNVLEKIYSVYPKRSIETQYTKYSKCDVYYGASQMQSMLSLKNLINDKQLINNYLQWNQDYYESHKNYQHIDYALAHDIEYRIPNDLLLRTDRATMAWGVEARVPFLDHKLVEYSMAMPEIYKIGEDRKSSKKILKELALKYFDNEFVYRPKMGFPIPVNKWILDKEVIHEMQKFIKERRVDCINYEYVRKMFNQHISGNSDYGDRLFNIFLLEKYLRIWNIS